MITDLQKANLTKRLSAFLFDGILLVVLVMAFALLLSTVLSFDTYSKQLDAAYDKYEKEYGVDFGITQAELEKLTPAEKEKFDTASEALSKDEEALYAFNMIVNLVLIITTGSVLLSFLVLEFAVPLKFGNGQTLGKKIFGIALMRVDGVKINTLALFIRTMLGKFTLETMLPLMIIMLILFGGLGLLGTVILGLILLVQVIMMIVTETNSMIHDKLANTVVVDMASQMIFGSELEQIAYKEKMHAEKVAKQGY